MDDTGEVIDARKRRTKAALRQALLAVLEEKPFDQVAIRELSKRADVGYATYFRHYPTKEALLHEVVGEEIEGLLITCLPMLKSDDTSQSTLVFCQHVSDHRKLWSALLTGGAAAIVRQAFIERAAVIAGENPTMRGWLPEDLSIKYGVGGMIDVVAWWLENGGDMPSEEIADILHRLVVEPILSQKR